MAIRGDFAALQKLSVQIGKIADKKLNVALKKNLAEEAVTQVKLGFADGRDPYGVPWVPLVARKGKPLLNTGRLRNAFTSSITPSGFRLGTRVGYASYHQDGTRPRSGDWSRKQAVDTKGRFTSAANGKRDAQGRFLKKAKRRPVAGYRVLNFRAGAGGIPARPMVPTSDRGGLGPIWARAFDDAARETFKKFMR